MGPCCQANKKVEGQNKNRNVEGHGAKNKNIDKLNSDTIVNNRDDIHQEHQRAQNLKQLIPMIDLQGVHSVDVRDQQYDTNAGDKLAKNTARTSGETNRESNRSSPVRCDNLDFDQSASNFEEKSFSEEMASASVVGKGAHIEHSRLNSKVQNGSFCEKQSEAVISRFSWNASWAFRSDSIFTNKTNEEQAGYQLQALEVRQIRRYFGKRKSRPIDEASQISNHLNKSQQNQDQQHSLEKEIMENLRKDQHQFDTSNCLDGHDIMPVNRARMVDWMNEVLVNFESDDQTFFYSVSIMDRYFKACQDVQRLSDLHLIGVVAMLIASKFQETPAQMTMDRVVQDMCHQKFEKEEIAQKEFEVFQVIGFQVAVPTTFDFLKSYLSDLFNIQILSHNSTKKKEKDVINCYKSLYNGDEEDDQIVNRELKIEQYLVERMVISLAKMCTQDLALAQKLPSVLAAGIIYLTLKTLDKINQEEQLNKSVIDRLLEISRTTQHDLEDIYLHIQHMIDHFDTTNCASFANFADLENIHYNIMAQLLKDEFNESQPKSQRHGHNSSVSSHQSANML